MENLRGFIIRRLFHGIITIWVIATLIFFLFRAMPGDPADFIIDPTFPPEVQDALLKSYGLDKPPVEQYLLYLSNMGRGKFGVSFFSRRPVTQEIGDRLLNTLILSLSSFVFAYTFGIAGGALLAAKRGTWIENLGVTVTLFFRSAPLFWTGMLALMIFSFNLGWFPHAGMRSVGYQASNIAEKYVNIDFLHHLIMPTVVAGLYFTALPLLLLRNTVLEVLDEDFIELARAKGLAERTVMFRHAIRNGILPVVTAAAVYIGLALGGMTVIEVVFSWPGLGRTIVQAVQRQDFPVAQAAFLLLALMVTIMNFIADILYAYLDPRITYH